MSKRKKNRPLKKIMIFHFFAEKRLNFNLCLGKHQLLHCNILYIYISILLNTYWVKFEILVIVFVSYKCTNGNIIIFIRALWPTTGNGPQRVFRAHIEKGNVFIIKVILCSNISASLLLKIFFVFEYKCMHLFSKTKCIFKYKCMHVNARDTVQMYNVRTTVFEVVDSDIIKLQWTYMFSYAKFNIFSVIIWIQLFKCN